MPEFDVSQWLAAGIAGLDELNLRSLLYVGLVLTVAFVALGLRDRDDD